jgi:transcriptional regulator with XRE-family HTH domain
MSTFVDTLRWMMEHRGWKQQEIAEALATSQANVSRWLAGGHDPSMQVLLRASKAFNVPLEELATPKPSSRVRESAPAYCAPDHRVGWLNHLKRRWHHKGAPRAEMQIAVRILFGDDTDEILAWLEQKP